MNNQERLDSVVGEFGRHELISNHGKVTKVVENNGITRFFFEDGFAYPVDTTDYAKDDIASYMSDIYEREANETEQRRYERNQLELASGIEQDSRSNFSDDDMIQMNMRQVALGVVSQQLTFNDSSEMVAAAAEVAAWLTTGTLSGSQNGAQDAVEGEGGLGEPGPL